MKKAFLTICMIAVALISHTQSLSPDSINNIRNTVVFIKVTHVLPVTGKEYTINGSGFFISKTGIIATNYHVVKPVLTLYNFGFPTIISEIKAVRNSGTDKHTSFPCTIIAVDKEQDLALLKIQTDDTIPYLDIDTANNLFESAPVYTFGFPLGEEFSVIQRGPELTITKGHITALRHNDLNNLTKIQFDASVDKGNSGGPLTGSNGKVLGVVNLIYGENNINMAVPSCYLDSLIKQLPTEKTFPDSTLVNINTVPDSASVFINSEYKGTTPLKTKVPAGYHNLCIYKPGYKTYLKDLPVLNTCDISEKLTSLNPINIVISGATQEFNSPDNKYEGGEQLFFEDFNNTKTFNTWEQSSGGQKQRTWFIEDGMLFQNESNSLLHAIYMGDSWDNYSVKARIKIIDKHDDSRAGVIFRETDDGFYLFRIHKETNKAQLAYHSKNPFGWFVITEKKLNTEIGDEWHTAKISCVGNNIICYLDNELVFNINATYSNKGRIGLYSVESKACFDSLETTLINPGKDEDTFHESGIMSFWFSEQFNHESIWWMQYAEQQKPFAFNITDAGFYTMENTGEKVLELTKYKLADFAVSLYISLAEGADTSSFSVIFRKNNDDYLSLSFHKKDNKVIFLHHTNNNTVIHDKAALKKSIFGKTYALEILIDKNIITCNTGEETIMLKNRNASSKAGTFGFSTKNLPVIYHGLTINSLKK